MDSMQLDTINLDRIPTATIVSFGSRIENLAGSMKCRETVIFSGIVSILLTLDSLPFSLPMEQLIPLWPFVTAIVVHICIRTAPRYRRAWRVWRSVPRNPDPQARVVCRGLPGWLEQFGTIGDYPFEPIRIPLRLAFSLTGWSWAVSVLLIPVWIGVLVIFHRDLVVALGVNNYIAGSCFSVATTAILLELLYHTELVIEPGRLTVGRVAVLTGRRVWTRFWDLTRCRVILDLVANVVFLVDGKKTEEFSIDLRRDKLEVCFYIVLGAISTHRRFDQGNKDLNLAETTGDG